MYTINQAIEHTIVIQKSTFIANLFPLEKEGHYKDYLEQMKKKFPDATHHCYAYIYHGKKKCSDDFEPSGTAGITILNVLEKKGLCNVLCVVTRYFGGIKLGAGGLVRAYTKATSEALLQASILPFIEYQFLTITFSYHHQKTIQHLLKEYEIIKKEYQETILYQAKIPKEEIPNMLKKLSPYIESSSISST